jgi:hypothetical protein
MRLFNFFKKDANMKNAENMNQNPIPIVDLGISNVPTADLFIENKPPQQEPVVVASNKTKMSEFLERNFFQQGYRDGYEHHNHDTQLAGIRKIRAEFLLIIDQMTEYKYEERLKMENLMIDVAEVSDDTLTKLANTIRELDRSIDTLKKQKELSVSNEGWISTPIQGYNQGFIQGTNDFLAEEHLINSINNL